MPDNEIPADQLHNETTGMPNKRAFLKTLVQLEAEQPGGFGLLMMDLNGLKPINDRLGHKAGDEHLRRAGRAISQSIRLDPGQHRGDERRTEDGKIYDVISNHLQGDEYAILLPGIGDPEILAKVQKRVEGNLANENISAALGGRIHKPGETGENLIHDADLLMLQRKAHQQREKFNRLKLHRKAAAKMGGWLIKFAGVAPPRI